MDNYKQQRLRAKRKLKYTGNFTCPNPECNYVGPAKRVPKANIGLGILLTLFWILPGILYFIFASGYKYFCPKCFERIRTDIAK